MNDPLAEKFISEIEHEFSAAAKAAAEGNSGKVRVCARRAAGAAVRWYLTRRPDGQWGSDAVAQLQYLAKNASFPVEIRDAADRLTARISPEFQYPSMSDPVADARTITQHFISLMSANASD